MACDEVLYRQYLSGDDEGLNALMKKYGTPLTLYIDGYLHDVHESEELMLDVFAYLFTKKPRIRDGGFKAYLYKAARNMRWFHIGVLYFVFAEYLLWTLGCFWPNTSPDSPTFWCDMLLTLAIFGLLPATRKAVEA